MVRWGVIARPRRILSGAARALRLRLAPIGGHAAQSKEAAEQWRRGTRPLGRPATGPAWQWLLPGAVGVGLGVFALMVPSLPSRWTPLAVLAIVLPFVAMAVGNLKRILLALILLDVALQLDIHLRYRPEDARFGALAGLNISVTTLALAALYALWLSELLARATRWPAHVLRASLPPALYLAFVVLSVAVARDVELALFQVFLLLQMFLLFVYVVGNVHTRQDVLFVVVVLLVGLVVESALVIGLRLAGREFSATGLSGQIQVTTTGGVPAYRLAGTQESPNSAAAYMSLLLAPAIGLLLTRPARGLRWLATLAFGLGSIALALTLSRGGWAAFALSMAILCVAAWHRGWLSRGALVGAAVAVPAWALSFYPLLGARLVGSNYEAAFARVRLMRLAFRIIADHPWLGIGANNYAVAFRSYVTPDLAGDWWKVVHNRYLFLWAETGMGGLAAFVGFLMVTVRRGWQCWKFDDRFLSPLALAFTAVTVAHAVHLLIEAFNRRLPAQLMWLIAALLAAMRDIGETRRPGQ